MKCHDCGENTMKQNIFDEPVCDACLRFESTYMDMVSHFHVVDENRGEKNERVRV